MKQFLSAGALLLLFTVFAFSFCFVRFSVVPDQHEMITATHHGANTDEMGRLHVSISSSLVQAARETWLAVKDAARSLPFFAADMGEVLLEEAWLVCETFREALDSSSCGAMEI